MRELLEAIKHINEETPDENNTKIKTSVTINDTVAFFFNKEDESIARAAITKILARNEDKLSIRERSVLALAMAEILPVIMSDRNIFSRIKQKKGE